MIKSCAILATITQYLISFQVINNQYIDIGAAITSVKLSRTVINFVRKLPKTFFLIPLVNMFLAHVKVKYQESQNEKNSFN